jgi:hypothetical protein
MFQRRYDYRPVLDPVWYSVEEVAAMDCVVPLPGESFGLAPEA